MNYILPSASGDKPKELNQKQNQTEQTKQDSAKDDEVPMEVEAPEIVETKTTKKADDVKREPKKNKSSNKLSRG